MRRRTSDNRCEVLELDFFHKYLPAKSGSAAYTLVLLHGTGGDEDDLIPLGQFLAEDVSLLGVRGKVLEGDALRFFRRLAEGVFDEEDLIFRTHELAEFLREASTAYGLNEQGLVAVGYSNGANIAASTLLLEPDVFSSAVLFRAMVPLKLAALPALHGKHVLMLSGRTDPIIPLANSEQLAQMLEGAGAEVTFHSLNTGHGLTNPELVFAKDWLTERLK